MPFISADSRFAQAAGGAAQTGRKFAHEPPPPGHQQAVVAQDAAVIPKDRQAPHGPLSFHDPGARIGAEGAHDLNPYTLPDVGGSALDIDHVPFDAGDAVGAARDMGFADLQI